MKKSILTLSALALAVSLGANAQDAGDVQVNGSIAPTPCTVAVSNADLNLGNFIFADLDVATSPSGGYVPAFDLTITCSADQNNLRMFWNTEIDASVPFTGNATENNPEVGAYNGRTMVNATNNSVAAGWYQFRLDSNLRLATSANNFADITCTGTQVADVPNFGAFAANAGSERGMCLNAITANTPTVLPISMAYFFDPAELEANDVNRLSSSTTIQLYYQ